MQSHSSILLEHRSAVLTGWKEVAAYLKRGVRTVQRWERDLSLPVHRPHAKARSAVIALPDELDAWLRTAPSLTNAAETIHDLNSSLRAVQELIETATMLRDEIKRAAAIRESRLHSGTTGKSDSTIKGLTNDLRNAQQSAVLLRFVSEGYRKELREACANSRSVVGESQRRRSANNTFTSQP